MRQDQPPTTLAFSPDDALVVIDFQERMLPAIPEEIGARALRQATTLTELAGSREARVLFTEQYPNGLGATDADLRDTLDETDATRFEKTHFDACCDPAFGAIMDDLPERVFVCGIEAHICVLSTVRSLRARGRDVIVPFDAVASRKKAYWKNALALMRQCGATVGNVETIVFDTLQNSKHAEFNRFSKMIR